MVDTGLHHNVSFDLVNENDNIFDNNIDDFHYDFYTELNVSGEPVMSYQETSRGSAFDDRTSNREFTSNSKVRLEVLLSESSTLREWNQ